MRTATAHRALRVLLSLVALIVATPDPARVHGKERRRGFTLWVRWLVHHSRERTRLTLHQSAGLSCIDGALGGQRGLHTRKR